MFIFKTLALFDWVVQLAVAVGNFAAANEQFKSLGEMRIITVLASEWRNLNRVMRNKRWVDQIFFAQFGKDLFDYSARTPMLFNFDVVFGCYFAHCCNVHRWVQRCAGGFACQINHARFAPRLCQVKLVALNHHGGGATSIARCIGDQLFGQCHHFGVVAKRLVALHHRELGVVARGDSFVAEHAANFKHTFHAAND